MTEKEQSNKYNAQHYDQFGDNTDIEFYPEHKEFRDWLSRNDSNRGKKRSVQSVGKTARDVIYYFTTMETLSEENLKLYKCGLQDRDYAPTVINGRVMAIRTFIKFLSQKYNAPRLVAFKASAVHIQPKQFIDNVISRADFDYLINESRKDYKNPNLYLGAKIMGTTGVRRCELLQVKVEHIKCGYLDVIGKGGKQRRIYFPKAAREELLEYLSHLEDADGGFVIRRWINRGDKKTYLRNTRDGGNLSEQLNFERAFNHIFAAGGKKYGIAPELMHPHGFRHFFAKEFLKNRLDIALLADLLGHSSLEITRIYLKMTSREQADVVDEVVTW